MDEVYDYHAELDDDELRGGQHISDIQTAPRKILIVSADIGEGHDLPARAIAREFKHEDPNALISIVNGLPAMGPIMTKVLRENSSFMFKWLPWLFDFQYRLFMDFPPTRWLAGRLVGLFGRRGMYRLVKSHNPDLIVSTYPVTTQILGELRRTGALQTPVYSSITDLAGLRYWAHPGVDLHFITHPESATEVESVAGEGSVRWAKPPTHPAFLEPCDRSEARSALGLPADGTVITVSGGGWGVGDVTGAMRAALAVDGATVICLCGHNADLRERVISQFGSDPRVRVLGFTNQMGEILAASDALVHSSAGLTVLEALIRGCPVVSYGFGYGHVRVSNEALERFGLARVARSEDELGPALQCALEARGEPNGSFAARPSTASLILANERRATPLPTWRVRTVRSLTAVSAVLAVVVVVGTLGFAYKLVSGLFNAGPITQVTTAKKQVGVMIDATPGEVTYLRDLTCSAGMQVSFALQSDPRTLGHKFDDCGNDAIPRLGDGGMFGWIGTHGRLDRLAREFHWGKHFLYATSGANVFQYLFAHSAGGHPVAGKVTVTRTGQIPRHLQAGEMIELRPKNLRMAIAEINQLREQLAADGLQAVTVSTLFKDSGTHV